MTRSATYHNWPVLRDQAGGSRITRDRRDAPGPRGSLFIYKSLETAVFSSICSECPRTRALHHHEEKKPPLKMSSDKTPLDQSLEDFLRFTGNLDDAVCPDNSPRGQASANKKKSRRPKPQSSSSSWERRARGKAHWCSTAQGQTHRSATVSAPVTSFPLLFPPGPHSTSTTLFSPSPLALIALANAPSPP